ncbi:MAG: hypothetical protein AAF547_10295 [Actinomycetota bacterium]
MTRTDATYVLRSLRATAREAIWYVGCRHEQGDRPNILLFATRRGGSTWAMELIGANRGVRPLNQPFATLSRNVTYAQMLEIPRFHEGQITSIDPSTGPRLERLVRRVLDGEIIINGPTKFWSRDFVRVSDRLVLKITDAKPVIDWFDTTFDVDIVLLTRHPIPQALSCIRNGWTLTVDSHLRDPGFVAANLDGAAEAAAHDVMNGDDELQKFVLNWGLENLAPLRLLPDRPDWLHVRYEACVAKPQEVLERMASRLGLTDRAEMAAVVDRPSGSSHLATADTVAAIRSGNAEAALERWRSDIDADAERRALQLLERLGIDVTPILAPAD